MESTEANEANALKQKISRDSARITAEIRAEIGELETEYIKARKEQKIGIFLLVLAFILPNILSFTETDTFVVLLMLAFFFYCVFYGFKLFFGKLTLIKRYNVSVNKIIFAKALSHLGLSGQMVEDGEAKPTKMEMMLTQGFLKSLKDIDSAGAIFALDDLAKSELITEDHNTNQVDNILEIKYQDSIFKIAELDIKHVTGSGKNRHTKNIFHGYFVGFDLKKELTGKTFVSAEADKQGFGNIAFFASSEGSVRETILEWNEFENLLHVATTDEVEARYILTPNFMHDLHDWWQGRETNIRLSFIKNRLYILYPDDKIRLNQTVEKIADETIAEYMFTIMWPIQNVMKLIDDVRL